MYIGNKQVEAVYLGNRQISTAYLGTLGEMLNLNFTSATAFNAAENQTEVGTIEVDKTGATFEILAGIDSAKFSINANSGVLTFLSAPDFETPLDTYNPAISVNGDAEIDELGDFILEETGNADNVYYLVVRATKGSATKDQTIAVTVTDVAESWTLAVAGQTSGTATAGTLVMTCSEDITPTVTGDVTISTARANDVNASYRKHTITVNCPNNGSGTIVIPDRSKVLSCGNYNPVGIPTIDFYSGTNTTAPKLTWNLNEIPSGVKKINQTTAYTTILPSTGNTALPSGLTFLYLSGANINWTYTGALPTGLTYLWLTGANKAWTYNGALPTGLTVLSLSSANTSWTYTGALPTGLTYLTISSNSVNWTYNGALPTGLTYLYMYSSSVAWTYNGALPTGLTYLFITNSATDWTGLDIGNNGNITSFELSNYRISKMSSEDMTTLLTQMTNRTGTLPATVIIKDYADYASPPAEVVTAVNTLKATKSITTLTFAA